MPLAWPLCLWEMFSSHLGGETTALTSATLLWEVDLCLPGVQDGSVTAKGCTLDMTKVGLPCP